MEQENQVAEAKGEAPSEPSQSSQPSQRSRGKKGEIPKTANLSGLIAIIETREGPRFLMEDGSLKEEVSEDGIAYRPDRPKLFPLPNEEALAFLGRDDPTLFDEVREFIYKHMECPDERHYGILAAHVMHTHLIEKAKTSPIIRFYGTKGSGKTRGGSTCRLLARRGIETAGITGPGLFRVNDLYVPTFMIDEIQIYGKKGNNDLRDMLNVRYKRGNKIIRINTERIGIEGIQEFEAFGPTILCGTDELPETIKSRCITIYLEPNRREVARHIDEERAMHLLNRLTAFRFNHFKTPLEEPDKVVQNGRLDEILTVAADIK